MKKGLVKISRAMLQDLLHFKPDWKIEEITIDQSGTVFNFVVSGSDFPEVVPLKECEIIFHTENIWVEVKERGTL